MRLCPEARQVCCSRALQCDLSAVIRRLGDATCMLMPWLICCAQEWLGAPPSCDLVTAFNTTAPQTCPPHQARLPALHWRPSHLQFMSAIIADYQVTINV